MINEILYLLFVFIASIAYMVRFGFFHRLLSKVLGEKILAEVSSLKVSAPNLKSTSDSSNSASP
jgi:hypothetical protein